MAVTKQTYTATATWTASGLADIFRSAFIDAGLMTEWHDAFLSGSIENRVLAVAYNAAKTYGTTYYWFQFTTGGVFYSNASGWNAASDIPSGTQYLDFYATTTNATTNHVQLLALATNTTVTLTRYTSSNMTFFLLRSGSNSLPFCIDSPGVTFQSWADLDRGYHNGLLRVSTELATTTAGVRFSTLFRCRRAFLDGCVNYGSTLVNNNYNDEIPISKFAFFGAVSNSPNNVFGASSPESGLALPYATTAGNPAFAAGFSPVYTGLQLQSVLSSTMPDDFGIFASRAVNTWSVQDTLTVTAGVEEYEVLSRANGAGVAGQPSALVLARTV